jgi:hypothetical protein
MERELALLDAACLEWQKEGSISCPVVRSHDRIRNQHLMEEVGEQQCAGQREHQQDNHLQRLEHSDGDVNIGRDAQSEYADDTEQRYDDFGEPHH